MITMQAVNAVIAQIFSTDTTVSITALGQLDELMKDNEKVIKRMTKSYVTILLRLSC